MSSTASINIVIDAAPGAESGRFVEVEDAKGNSIKIGEWAEREDGTWALRIDGLPAYPCTLCEGNPPKFSIGELSKHVAETHPGYSVGSPVVIGGWS